MTNEQADLFNDLFESGYKFKCFTGPYMRGFVTAVYPDHDDNWLFDDGTYTGASLSEHRPSDFECYVPVEDWTAIDTEVDFADADDSPEDAGFGSEIY
jgi:hypothetical protein